LWTCNSCVKEVNVQILSKESIAFYVNVEAFSVSLLCGSTQEPQSRTMMLSTNS